MNIELYKYTNGNYIRIFAYVTDNVQIFVVKGIRGMGNVRMGGAWVGLFQEIWWEISCGKVSGSVFFSRRELPGRELSGRELSGRKLSAWVYCPGGYCPGNLSGGDFTSHRFNHLCEGSTS